MNNNILFKSPYAIKNKTGSRRDDLYQALYNIIYFKTGIVPFDDLGSGKDIQIFMKENTPVKDMCSMYECSHMLEFATYID